MSINLSTLLQEGTTVQTLILSKDRFPTLDEARQWTKDNDFKDDKVDEPEDGKTFRFRQIDPDKFKTEGFGEGDGKFRVIDITDGVQATIGFLQESTSLGGHDDEKESNLQLQDGHIHEDQNGNKTGPDVVVDGKHYHGFRGERTSENPNTPDHTHTMPDGTTSSTRSFPNRELKDEDEKKLELHFDLSSLTFSDDSVSKWLPILTLINNQTNGIFGKIDITKRDLKQFKENFDKGIPNTELPIDYFHENSKLAAGWIKQLSLKNDESELWAFIEFTPNAVHKIREKEVRFLSADYFERFENKKNGEVIKNVLMGGGLTNRPFLNFSPIKLSENFSLYIQKKGEDNMDNVNFSQAIEDLNSQKKLYEKSQNEMAKQLSNLAEEYKADNKQLSEKLTSFKKENDAKEFETTFSTLLSEGKITPAMKEKLQSKFSGKELQEFYSDMPILLAMDSIGSSLDTDDASLTKDEQLAMNKSGLTKEDIIKYRT